MPSQIRVSFILCPDVNSLEGTEILFFSTSIYPAYSARQTIYLRKTLTPNAAKTGEKPLKQTEYRILDVHHNLHQEISMGMNRAEAHENIGVEVFIAKA